MSVFVLFPHHKSYLIKYFPFDPLSLLTADIYLVPCTEVLLRTKGFSLFYIYGIQVKGSDGAGEEWKRERREIKRRCRVIDYF